jgi:hypothetical protein
MQYYCTAGAAAAAPSCILEQNSSSKLTLGEVEGALGRRRNSSTLLEILHVKIIQVQVVLVVMVVVVVMVVLIQSSAQ